MQFLLDLFDVSSFEEDVEDKKRIFGKRNIASDNKNVNEMYLINDPRVITAFGVLQKYDYVTWENFITDYISNLAETNPRKVISFDEFTPRMRMGLNQYVSDLQKEKGDENTSSFFTNEFWSQHFQKVVGFVEKEFEHSSDRIVSATYSTYGEGESNVGKSSSSKNNNVYQVTIAE